MTEAELIARAKAGDQGAFEQLVLAELIESGDFERHINRVRRAKRRALAAGEI